ncbi:MAG: helix-turn-helix transcriptional regulator [bacterium]|nr:helix-turn-helix transcriptional regulator [bacterium]
MDKLKQKVCAKLLQIREHFRYTRPQMASFLRISESSYYKNEKAETFPALVALQQLAGGLDISMDWFLFEKGPMYFKDKVKMAGVPEYTKIMPDVKELLNAMVDDPQLRYEVMLNFHKSQKAKNKS